MKSPYLLQPNLWLEQNDQAIVIAQPGKWSKSKGHCLIVPRREVTNLWDLTPQEWTGMQCLLHMVKARVDKEFKPDGYKVLINYGRAAQQTVDHMHMHVIPCYRVRVP